MKTNKKEEPSVGVLTKRMDIGSKEFDEFQAIVLNKSKAKSEKQKRKIELMALKIRMEDYLKSEDNEIVLPGEFIKACLEISRVRQNKFAEYIGLKPSNLSKLIGGERPINHEIAIILGKIFNVEAMLWLNIQSKNELIKMKQSNKKKFAKYSLDRLINE